LEKTLQVLNELETKGLVKRYAIGGGIAVLYYAEPILTFDLDVFCLLPEQEGGLVTLSPIYSYLKNKGYKPDEEHIIIEGLPVQFIPVYNKLVEEALVNAISIKFKKVNTKIVRLEYLLAIMLQTSRPKDRERIFMLLNETQIDESNLIGLLKRHNLLTKWREVRGRYGGA
jgi:hypothetical protein